MYAAWYDSVVNAQTDLQRPEFICSTVDQVPDDDTKMQLDRYSADAGFDRKLLDTVIQDFKLTPFGTSYLGHRWRRSDGLTPNTDVITLGVHFLNGSENQKAIVRNAASGWLTGVLGMQMKFEFDMPRSRAQITVNFDSHRNNSIVGRASAEYARSYATMNLADVVDYIVQHEFGHAIGLQHEHQNPSIGIRWNKPVVLADMAQQGWTPQMVEDNIFTVFSTSYACVGDPAFNRDSIMLYPIPSRWTLDGFHSDTNRIISSRDRRCLEGVYRA